MKNTFYYIDKKSFVKSKRSNTNQLDVYKITRQGMAFICSVQYNNASFMGKSSECVQGLVACGAIAKKYDGKYWNDTPFKFVEL